MDKNKFLLYILILVMFIWGLLFVIRQPIEPREKEPFVGDNCQTTLIKDGNTILLYDNTKATVPGVNPIKLKSLDEYKEYISWQRANHIRCPILHLEKVYTTQGSEMYEIRQNFIDKNKESGANLDLITTNSNSNSNPSQNCNDASISHPPFNSNQFPAFDKQNQTQGNPGVMTLALM
jgi:hypothetical protein